MELLRQNAQRRRQVKISILLVVLALLYKIPLGLPQHYAVRGRGWRQTRLVLEGHSSLMRDIFRIEKRTFFGIMIWLRYYGGLLPSLSIDIKEKTLIFLY